MECAEMEKRRRQRDKGVLSLKKSTKPFKGGTPMQELDFSCEQSIAEAFDEIQQNLSEDLMAKVERKVEGNGMSLFADAMPL
jgi:hypothetical protein